MPIEWAVNSIENKPVGYCSFQVGITDESREIFDAVCCCEYLHEAEMIKAALAAFVEPGEFYKPEYE